jgi:peptide deformylase
MTDKILVYPDKRLRLKAEPVAEITPEIRERALGLVRLMNEGNGEDTGIGLAATQVGWPVRILVMKWTDHPVTSWAECEDKILVNPRIQARGGGRVIEEEGCLSFPGIKVKVERDFEIDVEATDLDGKTVWHCSEGIVARCMQHELDHLDGISMVDRLTPARKAAVRGKLKALERGR